MAENDQQNRVMIYFFMTSFIRFIQNLFAKRVSIMISGKRNGRPRHKPLNALEHSISHRIYARICFYFAFLCYIYKRSSNKGVMSREQDQQGIY